MADTTETTVTELAASLDKLDASTHRLDEVLSVLFDTFAERGIKPSIHLTQAQEKVRREVGRTREASQRVLGQLGQLRELVRTSALITSSLELEQVLQEVMDTVIALTGAERAYLMLYDDRKQLQIRAARNWERETLTTDQVGYSRSIIDAAIADGTAIITTNAQADQRFGAAESIVVQKLRSIICIPLALAGNTVGVLYADNRYQKDLFEQELVPVLTAFGTQAAIAISNAQLFGQVKENLVEAQRVIDELKIQVDEGRLTRQVSEITETEYFQALAATAHMLRHRFHSGLSSAKQPASPDESPDSD